MEPPPSPQPQSSIPVKKIVFVLLGIAAVAWYIGQRNTPTASAPLRPGHNSMANDMSAGTSSPATPTSTAPAVQNEAVERYPMIASPAEVQPEQEFPIVVSLTEEPHPDVSILKGNQTPEGKLILSLPAGQDSWKLGVLLSGDGLEFTQGTNSATIDLPAKVFPFRPRSWSRPTQPLRPTASFMCEPLLSTRQPFWLTYSVTLRSPAPHPQLAPKRQRRKLQRLQRISRSVIKSHNPIWRS